MSTHSQLQLQTFFRFTVKHFNKIAQTKGREIFPRVFVWLIKFNSGTAVTSVHGGPSLPSFNSRSCVGRLGRAIERCEGQDGGLRADKNSELQHSGAPSCDLASFRPYLQPRDRK